MMHFAFKNENGETRLRTFEHPVAIVTTTAIDEVIPSLQRVLQFTRDGFYAAGYVSYEAAPAFDAAFTVHEPTMPLLYFAIYERYTDTAPQADGSFSAQLTGSDTTENAYAQAIETIKTRIEDGITYQTNYTVRLYGEFEGDKLAFFNELQHAQQAGFTAYLQCDDSHILSASPELFFHLKGRTLTTKPMKGTSRRGKSAAEDMTLAAQLYESEKNRAENVMIVDLLRNDLGKIAMTDSVEVTTLFDVEHYPTVHQMTSTVQATLRPELNVIDVFKALFPCGSITGAPKVSTMHVIHELEASPRDVYCGAIGFITPEQEAIFNVPIRTAILEGNKLTYGVGGGITWDSTASGEFDEVLAKAQVLTAKRPHFELLESLLLEDGQYFLLERHLERLQQSARYFGFPFDEAAVHAALKMEAQHKNGLHKVRLVLAQSGELVIESAEIQEMGDAISVALARTPVNSDDVFLYHKTTHRTMYTAHDIPAGCFDVLLYNERAEVTEFTFGNVVYKMNGQLYTPPVSSGLLAGTYRAELLADGEIQERVLLKHELAHVEALYFMNSVRKMKKARLLVTEAL